MALKITVLFGFLALTQASFIGNDYSSTAAAPFSSSPVGARTVALGSIKKTIITPNVYSTVAPVDYEAVILTRERKFNHLDGVKNSKFSKSVDTAYSSDKFDSRIVNGDKHDIPTFYASQADPVYYNYGYSHNNPYVDAVFPHTKSVPVPITYSAPISRTAISPVVPYDPYVSSNYAKSFVPLAYSPSLTEIRTPSISYELPVERSSNFYNNPLKAFDKSNIVVPINYSSQIYKKYLPSLTYGPGIENSINHISHGPVVVSKSATTYSQAPVVSHLSFSGLGTNYGC